MNAYHSFSCCALGASHKKNDLVCQDASLDNEKANDKKMSIAVVADGHGSPQYFRSDIGSQKAAEAALRGIRGFIAQNPAEPKSFADGNGEKLLEGLARNIIATWFSEVEEDEKNHPLKDDERLSLIGDRHKDRYLNDSDHQYFHHAYGTTLIAVAVTEDYWFGLHIGDGKCVVLFDDGNWEQPIPWDDKCFLNSTTSICDDDAISEFRFWCGPTSKDERKPVALFVGSDGVDDTYPVYNNEKHLRRLYRSVVLSFAKDGFENTLPQIDELVQKLAEHGSQDDVSIAGIIGDVTPLVELLTTQDEVEKADDRTAEEHKKAEAEKQIKEAAEVKAEQQKSADYSNSG
jgi:serine/threonine protein phosphatase PrpC